jgi:hypothetical protein
MLYGTGVVIAVSNDLLVEQGRTPSYVGLLSMWRSAEGDLMFFPILEEGSFSGTPVDINE